MNAESSQKIYLTDQETASFQCPKCNASKEANVSKYKNVKTSVTLNVKCPYWEDSYILKGFEKAKDGRGQSFVVRHLRKVEPKKFTNKLTASLAKEAVERSKERVEQMPEPQTA